MKLIYSIHILALLLAFVQPVSAELQNEQGILHPKGLLWKIEKPGMVASYLYGTMHVGDPRVTTLSPEVERAFTQADYFVMELILNFKAVGYVASASFFSDGQTLKAVMGNSEYKRLIALLGKRLLISEEVVRHMKPWAVFMMLMMPVDQQMQASAALDMVLFRRASQLKIPVSGLESAEEQVAVFESMSIEEQVWMLNRSVEEIDTSDAQMPNMLNAYLAGDLGKLVQIQQQFMYEDSDIDDRFMYQLLDLRNQRMAERMLPVLKKGNAFVAIGALHLPGIGGVLHLLEKKGYSVVAVY